MTILIDSRWRDALNGLALLVGYFFIFRINASSMLVVKYALRHETFLVDSRFLLCIALGERPLEKDTCRLRNSTLCNVFLQKPQIRVTISCTIKMLALKKKSLRYADKIDDGNRNVSCSCQHVVRERSNYRNLFFNNIETHLARKLGKRKRQRCLDFSLDVDFFIDRSRERPMIFSDKKKIYKLNVKC